MSAREVVLLQHGDESVFKPHDEEALLHMDGEQLGIAARVPHNRQPEYQ